MGRMALYHQDRQVAGAKPRAFAPQARWSRGFSLVVLGLASAATWAVIYALIELAHFLLR